MTQRTYIVPMPDDPVDADWAALAEEVATAAKGAPVAFGIPASLVGVATVPNGSLLATNTPLPVMVTVPSPPPPPAPVASPAQVLAQAADAAKTLADLKAAIVAYANALP